MVVRRELQVMRMTSSTGPLDLNHLGEGVASKSLSSGGQPGSFVVGPSAWSRKVTSPVVGRTPGSISNVGRVLLAVRCGRRSCG